MIRKFINFVHLLFLLSFSREIFSYEISGSRWMSGSTTFFVQIPGISPSGLSWNDAFKSALNEWSQKTVFQFQYVDEFQDPCIVDQLNGVAFTSDICGVAYGKNTLAVTMRSYRREILGEPSIIESDIVINNTMNYDVYDGSPRLGRNQASDFRRMALHELGHAIGLEHEENSLSIMAPSISSIDRLTADDIDGVKALYSGLIDCPKKKLIFGRTLAELNEGDCTVSQITGGGADDSFIDLYPFSLSKQTTVNFAIESQTLDAVLLISNPFLEINYLDYKTKEGCGSELSANLEPGDYMLLANTFAEKIDPVCDVKGAYELFSNFESDSIMDLGETLSTGDGSSRGAKFQGGILIADDFKFTNNLSSDEALNVIAAIYIDPIHINKEGFFIVVAEVGSQIFALNSSGEFTQAGPTISSLPKIRSKRLEVVERIDITKDFLPKSRGINDINVNFYVAYGLYSNTNEIYYHQLPINVTISEK